MQNLVKKKRKKEKLSNTHSSLWIDQNGGKNLCINQYSEYVVIIAEEIKNRKKKEEKKIGKHEHMKGKNTKCQQIKKKAINIASPKKKRKKNNSNKRKTKKGE